MPKLCKLCPYPCFSGGYCIRHYHLLPKQIEKRKIMASKRRYPAIRSKTPKKIKKPTTGLKTPNKATVSRGRSSYRKAVETADKWFSRYVRLKFASKGSDTLYVKCVTSGRWYDIKTIQLGQYMSRRYMATRWELWNCGPQCVADNKYRNGEPQKMALWLDQKYGKSTADNMRAKALIGKKTDEYTIRQIAKHWREEFNKLTVVKGNPWKN